MFEKSLARRGDPVPRHRLLISGATFFFLLISFSPALAQADLPALIKKVEPSIVVIFNYDREGTIRGQGTGFFINKSGDVVTNYHVLQGASRSEIKFLDGESYPIKGIIAEDQEGDLIRISVDIPQEKVTPLPISAVIPQVGEKVLVIGTPLGLDQTVSDGIVSAIREIPEFGKIVQMTAPISPGSSGSPVLNMKGEVIGVATFLMLAGQNLNFAIPGERISKMATGPEKGLPEHEEWRQRAEAKEATELYATGLRYL